MANSNSTEQIELTRIQSHEQICMQTWCRNYLLENRISNEENTAHCIYAEIQYVHAAVGSTYPLYFVFIAYSGQIPGRRKTWDFYYCTAFSESVICNIPNPHGRDIAQYISANLYIHTIIWITLIYKQYE